MSFLPAGSYVIEHKTTAEDIDVGSTYWKRLTLDGQVSTYNAAAQAMGFVDLRGIIYDVIKKPTMRPLRATPIESRKYTEPKSRACKECKKKNAAPGPHVESIDGVDVACVEGRIVTDPGGRLYASMRADDETPEEYRARLVQDVAENPEKYYRRGEIVRLDDEEREHDADTWSIAEQIRASQKSNRWPRNTDACDAWGSFCTYWPVCAGEATIEDDRFYRNSGEHEELEGAKVHSEAGVIGETKRRLPLVTASSLKAYRQCQRKYYYAYELKRRSAHTSDVLRFGTLIHKALEAWWKTADIDIALDALAGECDPFEYVRAEVLILGYHVRWLGEPFEVLGVETEFAVPLVNPETSRASRTWMRGGKMDALARVT